MRTTPVVVQTMLHIYSCPQPLRDVPAVAEPLGRLREYGLIESINEDSGYRCTDRGLCWVNMLLDTPLPMPAYLDPRTNEAVSAEFLVGPGVPMAITDIEVPVVSIHDVMVEEEAKRAEEDLF